MDSWMRSSATVWDFAAPVGTNLSLRCPQHTLFRNSGGVNYPYPIGDMGALTTSGFGPTWYCYFYDRKVRSAEVWCPSERVPVTVNVGTVGIADGTAASGWVVYPVPAQDVLRVAGALPGEILELLDLSGRLVRGATVNGGAVQELYVGDLAPGTYMLRTSGAERHVVRQVSVFR